MFRALGTEGATERLECGGRKDALVTNAPLRLPQHFGLEVHTRTIPQITLRLIIIAVSCSRMWQWNM